MGRRSLASLLRRNRRDSAASAALGGPVGAGDEGRTRGANRRAGNRAGPGVACLPGSTRAGRSDAGAPARPDTDEAAPDLLTPEATAAGFVLEWIGDRVCLSHHCGNTVQIDEPTRTRVRWYVRTHRCRPADSTWHIGAPQQQQGRQAAAAMLGHLAHRQHDAVR
ncbi:MAG TPA: hypothetical protein VFI46_08050 [Jiangellaceae bacterium]|nr:hypothetical protein [Jiangellaceae bacterium]